MFALAAMASGWGVTGKKGRCYDVWMDFSDCMSHCTMPAECTSRRDDYFECLHHRKEVRRCFPEAWYHRGGFGLVDSHAAVDCLRISIFNFSKILCVCVCRIGCRVWIVGVSISGWRVIARFRCVERKAFGSVEPGFEGM